MPTETGFRERERWGRPSRNRVSGVRRARFEGGHPRPDREAMHTAMLRLLHTADVHLGARHADLGEAAAAQRERQFAAFRASIDLAIAERVDVFLVAGDLFDSNVQPRRSVDGDR